MPNIIVLTSGPGRGSNFEALVEGLNLHPAPIRVSLLVVTRPDAPVLERAVRLGVPSVVIPYHHREEFGHELLTRLQGEDFSLIALAGFMRLLSEEFIRTVGCPILNIHPALLPKYGGRGMYGMNVHEAVFAAHEKESGVTIHRVNEHYDAGTIVAQERVDITDCHSPEEIAAKVLKIEHRFYAETVIRLLNA